MSAPVGRETPGRRMSTLLRKTESLAKRPAPIVGGGAEHAYLLRTTDLTMTTGTSYFLDNYQTALSSVSLTADATAGTITASDAGVFLLFAHWDSTITFNADGLVKLGLSGGTNNAWGVGASAWQRRNFGDGFISAEGLVVETAGGVEFFMNIMQQSGSDKTMNNARLIVVKFP